MARTRVLKDGNGARKALGECGHFMGVRMSEVNGIE
jgi:hypothetical protein